MRRRAERQEHWRWTDTNHPCPSPARLRQAPLLPSRKGNPSSHQLPVYGVGIRGVGWTLSRARQLASVVEVSPSAFLHSA